MVPAFPLDGGRILRSILVKLTGDFFRATKISTTTGIIFSYLFMGLGAVSLFAGNTVGGIWIMILGWFLNNGVKTYRYYFELQHLLQNVLAKDIMNTHVIAVNGSFNVEETLNHFRMHLKSELPVVDDDGRTLLGMIRNTDALKVEKHQRNKTNVKEVMMPKNGLIVSHPDEKMDEAFMEMIKKRQGKVFVCDITDNLLGIISKTDLLAIASERQEYIHSTKSKI